MGEHTPSNVLKASFFHNTDTADEIVTAGAVVVGVKSSDNRRKEEMEMLFFRRADEMKTKMTVAMTDNYDRQ